VRAEILMVLSFRGVLFAEESLFSLAAIEERFLAPLGMTKLETIFAAT